MTSRKHQREYARRRYEKWQARQAAAKARARRRRIIAGSVAGALALVAGVVLVIDTVRPDAADAAASDPTATPTPTADAEPTPEPSVVPPPDPALAEGRTWTAVLHTTAGDITLELDGAAAPQAVASFVHLTQQSFFTSTTCHRLTTSGIFVLQCGDPTGTGSGGPDYRFGPIENAPVDGVYPAGTVAMARVSGDGSSMGSQFFLVYEDSTIPADSAGGYTVLGQVVEGMDVLEAVAEGGIAEGTAITPAVEVTIEGVEIE